MEVMKKILSEEKDYHNLLTKVLKLSVPVRLKPEWEA